jgi:hypothetical protein
MHILRAGRRRAMRQMEASWEGERREAETYRTNETNETYKTSDLV